MLKKERDWIKFLEGKLEENKCPRPVYYELLLSYVIIGDVDKTNKLLKEFHEIVMCVCVIYIYIWCVLYVCVVNKLGF